MEDELVDYVCMVRAREAIFTYGKKSAANMDKQTAAQTVKHPFVMSLLRICCMSAVRCVDAVARRFHLGP